MAYGDENRSQKNWHKFQRGTSEAICGWWCKDDGRCLRCGEPFTIPRHLSVSATIDRYQKGYRGCVSLPVPVSAEDVVLKHLPIPSSHLTPSHDACTNDVKPVRAG